MSSNNVLMLGAAINGAQFFTANGNVNIGGNVYTYLEGTLTPCNTYTDITGTILNSNPIEINGDGYLSNEVWTIAGTNVRVRIVDSSNNLLQDLDHITGMVQYTPNVAVYVIDSIYATDTSNAASANAANWLYKIANAAYNNANTNANNIANVIANSAGATGNTVTFEQGATTVNVGNTIYFQNTAFANIAVTAHGSGANIQVFANGSAGSTTANGTIVVNGVTLQWAHYSGLSYGGEAGPNTLSYPTSFSTACLSGQVTSGGGLGEGGINVVSFGRTSFTFYTGYSNGGNVTDIWLFVIGY